MAMKKASFTLGEDFPGQLLWDHHTPAGEPPPPTSPHSKEAPNCHCFSGELVQSY